MQQATWHIANGRHISFVIIVLQDYGHVAVAVAVRAVPVCVGLVHVRVILITWVNTEITKVYSGNGDSHRLFGTAKNQASHCCPGSEQGTCLGCSNIVANQATSITMSINKCQSEGDLYSYPVGRRRDNRDKVFDTVGSDFD